MLVSLASTGSGVLFQGGVLFSIENAFFLNFFWPVLANLGYFVANLRTQSRTVWWTFYRPE